MVAIGTPLIAIALSWWSFIWAEKGSTPDGYGCSPWAATELRGEEGSHYGMRARSRMNARTCFDCGALLLAAAVPAGMLVNDMHASSLLFWLLYGIFVVLTVGRAAHGILTVWRSRKEDAFNFWFSGRMYHLYDPEKAKPLFEELNPMQIWSLLDHRWFEKIRNPDINDVARVATRSRQ